MLTYWIYLVARYTLILLSIFFAGLCLYLHTQSGSGNKKLFMMIFSVLFALMLIGLSVIPSNKAANTYIKVQASRGNLVEKCGDFIGTANEVNTSRGGGTQIGFILFKIEGELQSFKLIDSKIELSQSPLKDLKEAEAVCVTYVNPPLLNRKILVSVSRSAL